VRVAALARRHASCCHNRPLGAHFAPYHVMCVRFSNMVTVLDPDDPTRDVPCPPVAFGCSNWWFDPGPNTAALRQGTTNEVVVGKGQWKDTRRATLPLPSNLVSSSMM
jgi:hypothetical protein